MDCELAWEREYDIRDVFSISWGASYHHIDVAMDINGGQNTPMSCTQLLSVPYALYAKESGPPGPTGPQGPPTLVNTTLIVGMRTVQVEDLILILE